MADFAINAESFRSKMQVPPELEKQYKAGVKLGLRIMFDKESAEKTLEYMDGSEEMPTKIGQGVAAVVSFIATESNGTFPGQLIIPVGVELIGHAAEVAERGGIPIDKADIAEGMAVFIETVLKQAGATPEQMQQLLGGMNSGQATPEV